MAAVEHAIKTCGSKAKTVSAMTKIALAVPATTARLNTEAIKPTQLKSNALGYMNKVKGMVPANVRNAAAKIPTHGHVPTKHTFGNLKASARTGAQNFRRNVKEGAQNFRRNVKEGAKLGAQATGNIVLSGLEGIKEYGQIDYGINAVTNNPFSGGKKR